METIYKKSVIMFNTDTDMVIVFYSLWFMELLL